MSAIEERWEGLNDAEVQEQLENECIRVRNEVYLNPFTEEEIIDTKKEHAENGVKIQEISDEIDELTSKLKEEKKSLNERQKVIVNALMEGGFSTTGKIYYVPDDENSIVVKYNDRGVKVGERPLTEEDSQMTLNASVRSLKKVMAEHDVTITSE